MNTMQTSSDTVDPNPANNTSSVATAVALSVTAPMITDGARQGATVVAGTSLPDPIPMDGCIHVFNCGTDNVCGNGDDVEEGTGSADANGHFVVNVVSPLRADIQIYAKEVCCNLTGPSVRVTALPPGSGGRVGGMTAPLLDLQLLAVLAALLGLCGAGSLWVQRRNRSA
jgi:hypothetical protein